MTEDSPSQTTELFSEKDIPEQYLTNIKDFAGAYEFITGRIDEFNTVVSVWHHAGTYKIIRAFILGHKDEASISVDAEMLNAKSTMAKLLIRY